MKFAVKILEKYLWKGLSLVKLQAFQNTYFPEHVSVAAFKPIQEILLIILKLLKSLTKFSLLDTGDEVWCKEYLHFCWYFTPLLFKKLISLLKSFKWCITLPLLAWSIFWYMAAGGQISTHVQIWPIRSKKNAKRIFYICELLNYKNWSKYPFRQLVHTELLYWICPSTKCYCYFEIMNISKFWSSVILSSNITLDFYPNFSSIVPLKVWKWLKTG